MDIRQLEYFQMVGKLGNITRAAERLHVILDVHRGIGCEAKRQLKHRLPRLGYGRRASRSVSCRNSSHTSPEQLHRVCVVTVS